MVDDSYYQMTRPEIVPLMPKGVQRILEIGCAAGGFRRNFGNGIEYWGVEPVESAASKADAVGNMKVLHGVYDAVDDQIPDDYFDAVVCNDVIEYMPDSAAFLKSVKGKLRAGGRLVGSVPNVRHNSIIRNLLFKRDWPYADSGILDSTHLRFFTMRSLRRFLDDAGWEVEYLKPSNTDSIGWLKKLISPLLFPIGSDVLYMQIAFRAKVR